LTDREYKDALSGGAVRGRGAGINPGNRFDDHGSGVVRLHVLGEHLDERREESPEGSQVRTLAVGDESRSILNHIDSPDLPFSWTLNPYRGCEHGCIYCYARPTHELLGWSCGLDFETKILVKREAPQLLKRELARPSWKAEPITISGVTDPYQPLERTERVTRACLEVLADCRQPIGIVTKNHLVTRDIDLLSVLAQHDAVGVALSVTTLDQDLAGAMEPRASAPRERLRAIRALRDAGIPVSVMAAPIIPGLNDHEIPEILRAAYDHGAIGAGWVLLRLPWQIKALFEEWLTRQVPDRAAKVLSAIRDTHDGELYESAFHLRQRGRGARAAQIARTFEVFARRLGLCHRWRAPSSASFRRPVLDGQMELFRT